ncbi:MAG: aminoacyl-tRNA hydrolase [bacterium]
MNQTSENKQFDKNLVRVIIGLGNPGAAYHKTRHNIGEHIVTELGTMLHAQWRTSPIQEEAHVKLSLDPYDMNAGSVYLIKPMTFMNNSGKVIPGLLKKGIKPDQIMVIHDELEKKFGFIDIKLGGSARGHNGLRSIIDVMGKDFWRLRFGIDRPTEKDDVGAYVLKPFMPQEQTQLEALISQAIQLILK